MMTIGVLSLQGAVTEHIHQINQLGYQSLDIKDVKQLQDIDGLIIPGGESTAIRKLIDYYGFFEPLQTFTKPIFGTCAGMVLLANQIASSTEKHLGLINICVKRNAFGRQRFSFEASLDIKNLRSPFPGIFIRAPYAESAGENVDILSEFDGHIVAAKQGKILVSAFHPELTEDTRMLELFIDMVREDRLVSTNH